MINEQNMEYEVSLRRDREKDRLIQEEKRREEEVEQLKQAEEKQRQLEVEQEEAVLQEIKKNLLPECDEETAASKGAHPFPSFLPQVIDFVMIEFSCVCYGSVRQETVFSGSEAS